MSDKMKPPAEAPELWDGGWLLVDHDYATGRCVWATQQDDKVVFRIDMPLDDIFTANREAEAATHGQKFADWNRIASVPLHLAYKNGLDDAFEQGDDKFISKWMNDPDNKKWRTSRGRV